MKTMDERAKKHMAVADTADQSSQNTSKHQNSLKSSARTYLDSQSVAETSLRSNYLDWASDWSSQDDDDDEYLHERVAGERDLKKKTRSCDTVSLSDLNAEDKFAPYPPRPQSHRHQSEGRNKRVHENRVHQKHANNKSSQRYQSPLDQYAAPSRKHEPCYNNMLPAPLPVCRLPTQSTGSTRSFTVISSDSEEEAVVDDVILEESGLGLSQFDLGVHEGPSVFEADIFDHSIYKDNSDHGQSRRTPRFGRTSHADKDGFLSDLYSMSRSRVHGKQ